MVTATGSNPCWKYHSLLFRSSSEALRADQFISTVMMFTIYALSFSALLTHSHRCRGAPLRVCELTIKHGKLTYTLHCYVPHSERVNSSKIVITNFNGILKKKKKKLGSTFLMYIIIN